MNVTALKKSMKKNKLSLYKLSIVSRIGYSTLHDIASGKTQNPSINTIIKIADALGEKVEDLI